MPSSGYRSPSCTRWRERQPRTQGWSAAGSCYKYAAKPSDSPSAICKESAQLFVVLLIREAENESNKTFLKFVHFYSRNRDLTYHCIVRSRTSIPYCEPIGPGKRAG